MKNKYQKRAVRIIAFLLIITLFMFGADVIAVHPDDLADVTLYSFYNEKSNSLDYVVLGASASQCGIYPAVVYKNSGLMGNDLCINGGDAKIYLSMLKELLSKQKNALIIVDLDGFTEYVEHEDYPASEFWIDSMQRGKNWFETINRVSPDNRIEHYFPVLKYHKNLLKGFDNIKYSAFLFLDTHTLPMKGAWYLDFDRLSPSQMKKLTPLGSAGKQPEALHKKSHEYLLEFIDYCKQNNVKNVVFCDPPKAYCDAQSIKKVLSAENKSHYCKPIIEKSGYTYLNFNDLANDYQFEKADFADNMHLNQYGAVKLSGYLSTYLKSNFTFREHAEKDIEEWNKSCEEAYKQYKLDF